MIMLTNDSLNQSGDTAATVAARPSSPIRLWLVDDDKPLRETMKDYLGRLEGISCTENVCFARTPC